MFEWFQCVVSSQLDGATVQGPIQRDVKACSSSKYEETKCEHFLKKLNMTIKGSVSRGTHQSHLLWGSSKPYFLWHKEEPRGNGMGVIKNQPRCN